MSGILSELVETVLTLPEDQVGASVTDLKVVSISRKQNLSALVQTSD